MTWTHRGVAIPLDVYHGVPKGWRAAEIVVEHKALGGTFDITGPDATEPGAPSWLPDRAGWLQYRQTLYRIADGVLMDDPACVELAVRFIVLRYIGSYSGFVRSLLARRLKHARINASQRLRLHEHFSDLILDKERTQEFREYIPLWRLVATEAQVSALVKQLRKYSDGEPRAQWLLSRLRPVSSGPMA